MVLISCEGRYEEDSEELGRRRIERRNHGAYRV